MNYCTTCSIHNLPLLFFLDCTFNVEIVKGLGGLGLSVSGGIDSSDPYPGLIRIKRLFPHQAAVSYNNIPKSFSQHNPLLHVLLQWMTGQLQQGKIFF